MNLSFLELIRSMAAEVTSEKDTNWSNETYWVVNAIRMGLLNVISIASED